MKYIKRSLAIFLSIAMVMCSTLPSFAFENYAVNETTESKIIEQLKEDLGEERVGEILNGNVGASDDNESVGSSTASMEDDASMGELCEPEEDEEESVNEYEFSEPEEDETEAEKETDRLVSDDELESKELESDENGLTEETIVAETEEAISETEIIESSEVESNDDEVVVATGSEIQDTLLDLDEIVSLSSNEKLLGAGEPWMWWYLADGGTTIHYTNTEPSTGGTAINEPQGGLVNYEGLGTSNITKAVFDNDIVALTCHGFFFDFTNLSEIDGIEHLNTSNVIIMNQMFEGCSSLKALNLSSFNTSNVTTMEFMFKNCGVISLDLRSFDTSNVTSMYGMFLQDDMDDKDWDWISEIKLSSSFRTSNVRSMQSMFYRCKNLRNINLSSFDTSNVTSMGGMFAGCKSLTSIDVSNFNTSNVTNMSAMFSTCINLTSIDISNFNTSNTTTMGSMFYCCGSLTSIDVSSFDTRNVTNMSYMFSCYIPDDWVHDDEQISNLSEIIGLSSFNTSNVINMEKMFSHCKMLTTLDLSGFNTNNVTNMASMFWCCKSLTALDISGFNTSNVTSMAGMFYGCINLVTLDLSSFNTYNVTSMESMFAGIIRRSVVGYQSIYTLDEPMKLRTIYASYDFVTTNVPLGDGTSYFYFVFYGCYELVGGNGSSQSTVPGGGPWSKEYARIDGGPTSATPGYFTLAAGAVPTLSGITVNTQPTKVKYKVGETFDPTGLKINLNYSDSSTTIVTYNSTTSSDFTFSPSTAFDTAGSAIPVTITYSGKNCIQNVVVIEPQSISIKTAPTKVKYAIGETFDPTGLKINLIYSDTTTVEEVAYAGNVSDFSFNPSGALNTAGASIPITITYTRNGNNFDCVQNVEVVELSTITINTAPSKTRYIKGTNFDPTGLKINLNYSDGTTNVVEYNSTTSSGFTFNGVATLTFTTNGNPFEITIGYAEKTITQNVIVA